MEEYCNPRATEGESIYPLNFVCVCMCNCVYLNYLRNHKITHIHEVGSEINIIRTTKEHNFSFCISDCLIFIDLGSTSTTITNIEKRFAFPKLSMCSCLFSDISTNQQ